MTLSIIDAHSHVWSNDLFRYPLAAGYTLDDIRPAAFTLDDFWSHAKPHGVERVNLIQSRFHGFDNRTVVDAVAASKGACVGTAVIDVHQPEPDRAMIDLAGHGIRAFRIHPRLSQRPPAEWLRPAGYDRMFAAGARHNLFMSCLIEADAFAELDRQCDRFPETPVVIDHLGRIGLDGVIRASEIDALCSLARHPRLYIKVGGFYALSKTPPYDDLIPVIERVIAAFGARRCMWESDCPYQVHGHRYVDSIDVIQNRCPFLSDDDKEWLLRGTAETTLFDRTS